MIIRLDTDDRSPLYLQIAASIRRSIIDGDVAEGDRLPPAREVAGALKVNIHTVLKAYTELRDDGLIEMRRGRGSVVKPGAASRSQIAHLVLTLVTEAKRHGLTMSDITTLITKEMT